MDPAAVEAGGMLNLEKELVCFICTEILFQPLTLIDCLHTFCGSCLKSWFQLQHHKACSSHHSSSTSTNPYTCPTCRATVKTARPNAMVNTWLELYLAANPSRAPTQDDKDEKTSNYKPGDDILPKVVRGRERRRRHRRDEEETLERRMIEEARERSLREAQTQPSPRPNLLQPNPTPQDTQHSRSRERDREREERRARRREVERQRRQRIQASEQEPPDSMDDGQDEEQEDQAPALPPTSSPRHPDAVEQRQRQQRVIHQASLRSLISSSESTTGSSFFDSLDENALRDLIMAQGLYDGIDLNGLTEAEQDVLAEQVAEAFRNWQQTQHEGGPRQPPEPILARPTVSDSASLSPESANVHRTRNRSGSAQRANDTQQTSTTTATLPVGRPRSSRSIPTEVSSTLTTPPSSVVVTQRRRRPSNQSQSNISTRTRSRQSSPRAGPGRSGSSSVADLGTTDAAILDHVTRPMAVTRASTEPHPSSTFVELADTSTPSPAQISTPPPTQTSSAARASTAPQSSSKSPVPQQPGKDPRGPRSASRTLSQSGKRVMTFYDEPSVTCFRCYRSDIQYEVYKYCESCDVSLCLNCYRKARGCKYWFGFGPSAIARFTEQNADRRDSEQVPLPHELIGRTLKLPKPSLIVATKVAKDGETMIPTRTMQNPAERLLQGYFCDRCGAFANETFYSCDTCNSGEWGFCEGCVYTHHCCTHPLRPIAEQESRPIAHRQVTPGSVVNSPVSTLGEAHNNSLAPILPGSSQPQSAASTVSSLTGPRPGFAYLKITTKCDQCNNQIDPSFLRYHCPFHWNTEADGEHKSGNYDICTPCYHGLVKSNRIKHDDGPAGWRKCPKGHRMIITAFAPDGDGGYWRVVSNDLVGGRYFSDTHIKIWMEILTKERDAGKSTPAVDFAEFEARVRGEPWRWRDDQSSDQRTSRPRNLSAQITHKGKAAQPSQPLRFQFPPDGGFGARGFARYTRQPEEGEAGKDELTFPYNAEIRELELVNEDFWFGLYAGDFGYVPVGYMRSTDNHHDLM